MEVENFTDLKLNFSDHTIYCLDSFQPDPIFFALTFILLFACILAFLTHVAFLYLLHGSKTFDADVRLLLRTLSFSCLYVSAHSFARCIFNFTYFDATFRHPAAKPFYCELVEGPFNVAVFSLTLSMGCVGLNRMIATKVHPAGSNPDANNCDTKPTKWAYRMRAGCWLLSCFIVSMVLVSFAWTHKRHKSIEYLCYCQTFLATPLTEQVILMVLFFMVEISTAVCYMVLFRTSLSKYKDFNIDTQRHSLAERHAVRSTVRTTITLCPSIILHGTVYACIFVLVIAVRYVFEDYEFSTLANWSLVVLIVVQMEMIIQPVLITVRREALKKMASERLKQAARRLNICDSKQHTIQCSLEASKVQDVSVKIVALSTKLSQSSLTRKGNPIVEFRLKPDQSDDIINSMWASKPKK